MLFFWEKTANLFPNLQTLNNHRVFFVNANQVIIVAVSSLAYYLLDGIGLISIGSL
jgi:hypothetical protein